MGRILSRVDIRCTISIALFSNDRLFGQFGVNKNHGMRPTFIAIIFYCGRFPSHIGVLLSIKMTAGNFRVIED